MQLSEDVHNYMETLVGQVLGLPTYSQVYSPDQLADLACLALSQLRPIYIRHDIDFLATLPEAKLVILKEYAQIAVQAAQSMIINDRRQQRDHDLPVIFTHARFDDDAELEWFEAPIVNKIKPRQ
ncbi:MAG: late competence development ComFB family protein [Vibrio sp.]|uniref:late competence development ComFB family protein n=1 Tax=Vibrio sp. TaxID=678 RepID=UPI003F36A16B